MKYVSTRGALAPEEFSNVLLEGLSPDGGLIVPQTLPTVSVSLIESWRGLSYSELAFEILSLFITDIASTDLRQLVVAAYHPSLFNSKDIVPLRSLGNDFYLLGLSEGPTLAFKDLAMQFLGQVFEYVLNRQKKSINILAATSGDTGSSAEYALRGKKNIAVFMLSAQGRMSPFQQAQMYSLQEPNIHNLALRGVFDECQDVVKALSEDHAFKENYRLGVVNSINWARIAAQIVYYFYGWLRATQQPHQEVSFAVPTGNFGNILAGHMARRMGLPIRKLVLVTNENNVLEEFFRTGIYRPRTPKQTLNTSSPSMDISKASNFERFIYDMLDADSQKLNLLWKQLADQGYFNLSSMLPQILARSGFVAGMSCHADRLKMIQAVWQYNGRLIDPHTADGVHVARQHHEAGVPMLVLETALAAKFSKTIEEALGQPVPMPTAWMDLERLPQIVCEMDCSVSTVKKYIIDHAITD